MNKRLFWLLWLLIVAFALFLRIFRLDQSPPSLYWEEAALGYDAYSIYKTGKDHHGNPFPIVAFESFGDWKPSGYFYAIIPFLPLFGLSLWAIRLPSVLSGLAIVIGVGELVNVFFKDQLKNKQRQQLQLISMAVTAVSPWAIQFSRAGWEVNLATALILCGVLCFIRAIQTTQRKQLVQLFISVTMLVLSMYTYHSARAIAPLLGCSLALWWAMTKKKHTLKLLFLAGAVAFILLLPLIFSLRSKSTNQRFAETSIFSDLAVIEESNLRKERANNSLLSRLFYHRYVLFGREMIINGMSHLDPRFLFITGDKNPRHSLQYIGELYHIETILLFLGLVFIVTHWRKKYVLLLGWLLVGLLPAAMTKATPHALRILPTLPVFLLVVSLGVYQLSKWLPKLTMPVLLIMYLGELTLFWRFYTTVYPKVYASEWQYGYEQVIRSVAAAQESNPDLPVYISREYGRPAMYYWFYTQTNPRDIQEVDSIAKQDQGEFLEYKGIKFINSVNEVMEKNALVASSPFEKETMDALLTKQTGVSTQLIENVNSVQGKTVWVVYRIETK